MKKYLLFSTLCLASLVGAGCTVSRTTPTTPETAVPYGDDGIRGGKPTLDPIKIGWVGPLTGDLASLGRDAAKAAEMAVEEVNAAGGVNGRKLELVQEDTKCLPKEAVNAGNKLINQDRVSAIVGGLCSGETMAIAPMAEENKTTLFSYCSSAPTVTGAGNYVFRSYPSDSFQGKFAAEYAFNTLGRRKVAILAVLGDWGTGIKNVFVNRFKELGGEVVFNEDFAQDTRDFRSVLLKLKQKQPDQIYFLSYPETAVIALKQAKELGLKTPILGSDGSDDPKVISTPQAEGFMLTSINNSISNEDWKARLKAKGTDATLCTSRSYDNVKVLAAVMAKVGTDPEAIQKEMASLKDYQGISGVLTFDENGDPVGAANYSVKVVKDQKMVEVK